MSKGCVFIVALILGALSNNAANAAMQYDGIYTEGQYDNQINYDNQMNYDGGSYDNSYDGGRPFGRLRHINEVGYSQNGYYPEGSVDPNCEYRSGPCTCYCPVTRFKPCYYTVRHCVQEPYCVYKRCCRMVPQYYQKQCCRYVPQYYCKTCCRYCPEYYCVPIQKCRTRICCERKCRYVPCTYMKKTCCDCAPPSGDYGGGEYAGADYSSQGGGCASGMCGR